MTDPTRAEIEGILNYYSNGVVLDRFGPATDQLIALVEREKKQTEAQVNKAWDSWIVQLHEIRDIDGAIEHEIEHHFVQLSSSRDEKGLNE